MIFSWNRYSHVLNPFPALDSGFQPPFGFQSLLEHLPDGWNRDLKYNYVQNHWNLGFLHGIMFFSHSKSSLKISDPTDFGNPYFQRLEQTSGEFQKALRRNQKEFSSFFRVVLHVSWMLIHATSKKFLPKTPSPTSRDFGNSRKFRKIHWFSRSPRRGGRSEFFLCGLSRYAQMMLKEKKIG